MIIGTAGHIDHGKTSLIKRLTGRDTDRLPEEIKRGISIELGYAYVPARRRCVLGFVDVPGHERFVHTMLAGATGIDFALLVVAADDGVMPQTDEHLDILLLLGIDAGAIALTKIDAVSAERVDEVLLQLADRVRNTAAAKLAGLSGFIAERRWRARICRRICSMPQRAAHRDRRPGIFGWRSIVALRCPASAPS